MRVARQPRIRNYHAEEQKRNAEAVALGYKNRYELRKARAGGIAPTAKAVRTDPGARRKQNEIALARRAGFLTYGEYRAARRRAKEWSDAHSRQPVSRYRPSMSPEVFNHYYYGLVAPWDERRNEFDLAMRKAYIVDDAHHMTEEEYDDDPRY